MNKQTFGQFIAEMRKEKNWTQLELAEKMGVTDKAVSKWERDLSFPDVASLPRLAEVFGVSIDQLMQIRSKAAKENEWSEKASKIVGLILIAIPLAMSVALFVLSVLNKLDTKTAFSLISIALFSLSVKHLHDRE
jgi:transcriptional regulator with XRE-family HTH domain